MTPSGTQLTDWVLTIKNGITAAASVQVYNPATGETVTWSNALAIDAWLRLSSATQRCEVSTDSGATWTRRNENTTGMIPRLRGGVSNAVVVTGPTTGTYSYTYTAKGV
jgi:hypothetical protein